MCVVSSGIRYWLAMRDGQRDKSGFDRKGQRGKSCAWTVWLWEKGALQVMYYESGRRNVVGLGAWNTGGWPGKMWVGHNKLKNQWNLKWTITLLTMIWQ